MLNTYKNGHDMKDSRVQWIGDIPRDWDAYPMRKIFSSYKEVAGQQAMDYTLLRLSLNGVEARDEYSSGKNPENYDTYQVFYPNDLVMCLFDYDVTPRTVGHVEEKGILTGAYTRLIPKKNVYSKYYYYLYLYLDQRKELLHLCTGLRSTLSKYVFWPLQTPYPPYNTQKQITDFLDEKTTKIDQVITKKQKLIELLKEMRISIITKAVTKGLDPKAKMRPSGVEWIGDIPESWKVEPLKLYFKFEKGKDAQKYTKDYVALNSGIYPVYSGQTEEQGILGNTNTFDYDYKEVIFVTTVGAKAMTPAVLKGRFSLSQNCLIMIPKKQLLCEYYYYQLFPLFAYERASIPSHMQPSLRKSDLNKYRVITPSEKTQTMIIDYLHKTTKMNDELIRNIEIQIDKLLEYRSSLIYNAVTGKIKI